MGLYGEHVIVALMLVTLLVFIIRAVVIIKNDVLILKKGYEKAENEYKAVHPDIVFNEENSFDILNEEAEVIRRLIPSDLNYGSEEILSDGVSFDFDEVNPKPACLFSVRYEEGVMKFFISEFLKTVFICAVPVVCVWIAVILL